MAKRTKKGQTSERPKKRRSSPKSTMKGAMPEAVPPGATRKALDRPIDTGGGAPGSAAGPRHAAGDVGSDIEDTGAMDSNWNPASPATEEEGALEAGPPYAGISGGAVGGSPAEVRSSGGHMQRRELSERHHSESTVGC